MKYFAILSLALSVNPMLTSECTIDDADYDGWSVSEGDCNDSDNTIYPGAVDKWYDGVDSNCQGDNDFDQDFDGFDFDIDCNDVDPTTYKGAVEHWDGVDSNCSNTVDESEVLVTYLIRQDGTTMLYITNGDAKQHVISVYQNNGGHIYQAWYVLSSTGVCLSSWDPYFGCDNGAIPEEFSSKFLNASSISLANTFGACISKSGGPGDFSDCDPYVWVEKYPY